MLNGVNVGDPAAIGFAMNYYDPSSFENIQVSSGAQDITVRTGGVFINMVTKSGTNRFRRQTLYTYQGDGTQWDNIDDALKHAGFRPDAAAVDYITNINFQVGGPLLRNKLFYFAALNNQPTHVNVPGFPAVIRHPGPLADTSKQDTTDIGAALGQADLPARTTQLFRLSTAATAVRQAEPRRQRHHDPGLELKEYDIDNVAAGARGTGC